MEDITYPEFTRSLRLEEHEFWLHINSKVRYDAIIGRDILAALKLDICYSDGTMRMEGRKILMKKRGEIPTFLLVEDKEVYATEIRDAKYEEVRIDDVITRKPI